MIADVPGGAGVWFSSAEMFDDFGALLLTVAPALLVADFSRPWLLLLLVSVFELVPPKLSIPPPPLPLPWLLVTMPVPLSAWLAASPSADAFAPVRVWVSLPVLVMSSRPVVFVTSRAWAEVSYNSTLLLGRART